VASLSNDLRCHELRGAGHAAHRRAASPGDTVEELARVEISELDDAVFGHEDVAALDIAVYYPVCVEEGEAAQNLVRVFADDALIEPPELLEHVGDAPAAAPFFFFAPSQNTPINSFLTNHIRPTSHSSRTTFMVPPT